MRKNLLVWFILTIVLVNPFCHALNANTKRKYQTPNAQGYWNVEDLFEKYNDLSSKYDNLMTRQNDLESRVEKLEELAKIGTLRTCAEYSQYGLRTSGLYMVDPDGPLLGHPPFQVFCNFDEGTTEVMHDSETVTEVQHCHDPGDIVVLYNIQGVQ